MTTARLLTPAEAARELGVSRSTIYEALRTGEIRCLNFGERRKRIPVTEIERLAGENGRKDEQPIPPAIADRIAEVRRQLGEATEALMMLEVFCRANAPEETA